MRRLLRVIGAFILLGIQAVILQPIRRIKNRKRSGESRFLEAYTPDRLLPLLPEELERRERFSLCINCGLCDVSCKQMSAARESGAASLSALATAYSRSMSEYPYARIALSGLKECADCSLCEAACPVGVPLKEMMADLIAHAARMEEAGIVVSSPNEAASSMVDQDLSRESES